ncbi:LysR family transcriptional regulator [Clostridium felsineum]|uniref:LysR family transcriptional regulator n=1 Tax=Clostridium felsineum TaxID=36839 RepID=UPI00214DC2C4|nr:LysR family transcriptional regulator [Clostridium felsineum]MCR3757551.1 LysR family transcriptional regulator [Clostridium felsineum]
MEFRQLSYFISAAKYLSFTKAAEEHYVAQTAISQQISSLEKHLNVKLFIRSNRTVQLTEAGRVLLREANLITSKVAEAEAKTKEAALGFEGTLSIGTVGPSERRVLPVMLKRFHELYPKISINIIRGGYKKLVEDLKNNYLDVIFVFPYEVEDIKGIEYRKMFSYKIYMAVSKEHKLAQYKKIDVKKIVNEKFVIVSEDEAPKTIEQYKKNCEKDKFQLNIVAKCKSLESMLVMVEAGIGIALVPSCLVDRSNENISYVKLENSKQVVEIGLAWQRESNNPTTKLFLNVVDELHIKKQKK